MSGSYNLEILISKLWPAADALANAIQAFADLCSTAERAIIKDMEEPAE